MTNKKILLVEDDESLRSTLSLCLDSEDFVVAEAQNGKEALDLMNSENFDLVITDIQMPIMDGIELLSNVQSLHPETPVITMTGFSNLLEDKGTQKLGIKKLLIKPFTFEDMLDAINEVLSSIEASKENKRSHLQLVKNEPTSSTDGIDMSKKTSSSLFFTSKTDLKKAA